MARRSAQAITEQSNDDIILINSHGVAHLPDPEVTVAQEESEQQRTVSIELTLTQIALTSPRAIMAGSEASVWLDVQVKAEPHTHLLEAKMAVIPKAARGHEPLTNITEPGAILFADIINNPSPVALLPTEYFSHYLALGCGMAHHFVMIGLEGMKPMNVINTLLRFEVDYHPFASYTFYEHLCELHVDAGSQLVSGELREWLHEQRVKLVITAPRHQEMNT